MEQPASRSTENNYNRFVECYGTVDRVTVVPSSDEQETQQSADIRVTDGSLCATKYQGKLATSLQPNRRHA